MSRARATGLLFALSIGAAMGQPAPGPANPQAPPDGPACAQAPPEMESWLDREDVIQRHRHLPSACLKSLVRECSAAAGQTMLDGGQALTCSIRYEALLRHGFQGDFQALLAWWHSERRP